MTRVHECVWEGRSFATAIPHGPCYSHNTAFSFAVEPRKKCSPTHPSLTHARTTLPLVHTHTTLPLTHSHAPPPPQTTADPRPNAYIPESLGIPKPYGEFAPFKPTDPGSTMRHTRKPQPKDIVI